jgi:hypothetical protein
VTLAVPVAAIVLLAVLAAIAKERKYEMTGASLMVVTGILLGWIVGSLWMFG